MLIVTEASTKKRGEGKKPKKKLVAIADDEESIREWISDALNINGQYDTVSFKNGHDLIDYLHNFTVKPDIIFLDHFFKDSIDGHETFLQIKHFGIPVIMFTGMATTSLTKRFIKDGGADLIEKQNCNISIIRETIELVTERNGGIEMVINHNSFKQKGDFLSKPSDVYRHMKFIEKFHQEMVFVIHLDEKNCHLITEHIAMGGIENVDVYLRFIFRSAIHHNSNSIIICHNHVSGDPTPSKADISRANQLWTASKIIGIPVLDNIIIGKAGFVSLLELCREKENGCIQVINQPQKHIDAITNHCRKGLNCRK